MLFHEHQGSSDFSRVFFSLDGQPGGGAAAALDPLMRFQAYLDSIAANGAAHATLAEALSTAAFIHKDDRRKDGGPYLPHPVETALFLIEQLGVSDPELIAEALLHDTHENHPELISLEEIGEKFGHRVCAAIAGLSVPDAKNDPDLQAITDARTREWAVIDRYQQHVATSLLSDDVYVIKLCDFMENALKLDNLSSKPQLQARLANKYLGLLSAFADRAETCPFTRDFPWLAQKFRDAMPGVQRLAEGWEYYPRNPAA